MPYSTEFNAICYLNNYPDLRDKWMFMSTTGKWYYALSGNHPGKHQWKISDNPIKHWQEVGQAEGRVPGCLLPGSVFDTAFNGAAYLARYPDVRENATYSTNPLGHYNTYGIKEGRIPGYEFVTLDQLANTKGISSPGTTQIINVPVSNTPPPKGTADINTIQDLNKVNMQSPGDGTIIPTTPPPGTNPNVTTNILAANPLLIAAGAGLLLILLLKKRKKTKR